MEILQQKKSERGFTLIELLAVIAIIGTLAAVVVTSMDGARKRSRDAERVSEVAQLQLALETYYNACRQYPGTDNLDINDDNGCTGTTNLGTFLQKIPTPPGTVGGTVYEYKPGVGNTSYVLKAQLETNDRALLDDVDGTPMSGFDCEDDESGTLHMYCVKS